MVSTNPTELNTDFSSFNWVKFVCESTLPSNSKHICLYLSTYMNLRNSMAFPSLKTIEADCSLGHATVLRHLGLLVEEGWLIKKSGSRTRSNQYTISLPRTVLDEVGPERTYVHSGPDVGPERTSNNNLITRDIYTDAVEFDRFWQIYPRKVGKEGARKAWAKIKCDSALFDKIYENIKARCESGEWTRERMTYIPHPATYLNGHRWEDELEPPQAQRQIPAHLVGTTKARSLQEDLEDTSWAN